MMYSFPHESECGIVLLCCHEENRENETDFIENRCQSFTTFRERSLDIGVALIDIRELNCKYIYFELAPIAKNSA